MRFMKQISMVLIIGYLVAITGCASVLSTDPQLVEDVSAISALIYADVVKMTPDRAERAMAVIDLVEGTLLRSAEETGMPNFEEAKTLLRTDDRVVYKAAAIRLLSVIQRRIERLLDPSDVERTKALLRAAANGAKAGLRDAMIMMNEEG